MVEAVSGTPYDAGEELNQGHKWDHAKVKYIAEYSGEQSNAIEITQSEQGGRLARLGHNRDCNFRLFSGLSGN